MTQPDNGTAEPPSAVPEADAATLPDDRETATLSQAVNADAVIPDELSQAADDPAAAGALGPLTALG